MTTRTDLAPAFIAAAQLAQRLDDTPGRVAISYSETKGLDCWRKHHFARRLGLRTRDAGRALQFGKAWDEFLNVWQGPRPDPFGRSDDDLFEIALNAGDWSLRKDEQAILTYNKHLPDDLDTRMQELRTLLVGMAHHYRLRWTGEHDEWEIVKRQFRFRVPLRTISGRRSPKFDLIGAIDVIARSKDNGDLAIWDNKSAASISQYYRASVELDRQLPLYAWAMGELGMPVQRTLYDVAAKKLPSFPQMRAQPLVILDQFEQPVMEAVPCDTCNGSGMVTEDVSLDDVACTDCDPHECGWRGDGFKRARPTQALDPDTGEPMFRPILDEAGEPVTFKGGARAGEVKTEKVMQQGEVKMRKVTRPALYSDAHTGSSWPVYLHALELYAQTHALEPTYYSHEAEILRNEWFGDTDDDTFFWREDMVDGPARAPQAAIDAYEFAVAKDTLPATAMPDGQKCARCSFKIICKDPVPSLVEAHFTTREERKRDAEERKLNEERRIAEGLEPLPVF